MNEVELIARLAPGVTVEKANAEVKTISSRLAQTYPDTNKGFEATAIHYTDRNTQGSIRVVLYAMQGAVAFVLRNKF